MKTVLLTGASGFIGRQCLRQLVARGFDVHAVSSRGTAGGVDGVEWHSADLLNPMQTSEVIARVRPSHLLHLAWYAVPGKFWRSTENLRWVQAGIEVFQTFHRHGGRRAVFAGSCAEYDSSFGYCSERSTPLAPSTLYGVCKRSLHAMLEAFSQEAGLSSAWGRVFLLYGPHEHPDRLVPSVIRSVLRGEPALCTHAMQIRDFLHVHDVAGAFVALLESAASGPVNIASGRPVRLKEVVGKIGEKLGRPDLIRLGALPSRGDDPEVLVAKTSRLSEEVRWSPAFDLDRGLEQTIDWWREHEGSGLAASSSVPST